MACLHTHTHTVFCPGFQKGRVPSEKGGERTVKRAQFARWSEIKVKPKNPRYVLQEAEIVINGYDCWPAISSSGRGVAIYTKNALQATTVNPLPDSSFKDAIWCEIRLCRGDKLLVGCVYRSPNSTNDNNALLLELLKAATDGRHSHVKNTARPSTRATT